MENLNTFARKVLMEINPEPELLEQILHPHGLYDISQSEAMTDFKNRLLQAKEKGEKILVAGDYDCDGIMSTTIFTEGLKAFGLETGFYIPDRIRQGYGLSAKTVQMACDKGYSLIITCDNGVKAQEALQKAKELGVDVIVTDHHVRPESVECQILVHPDLLEEQFASLCGAGIAFECIRALGIEQERFMIYAAVASIADCMEVCGQTREIIQQGLALFNQKGEMHLDPFVRSKPVCERDIAFQVAPKINAIGRLADRANVNTFVRYMQSTRRSTIEDYAQKVCAINDLRKRLSEQVYGRSQLLIHPTRKVLLAADASFHEGIIGLAAGNLCSNYCKPAIICTRSDEGYKGSMRAPRGFHCLDFLSGFDGFAAIGGHAQAAGFTIKPDRFADFETYVFEQASSYKWELEPEPVIEIEPSEINTANIHALDALRPFGSGFELPKFAVKNPPIISKFDLSGGTHRKFQLANGIEALNFNQSETDARMDYHAIDEIIGTLSLSSFRGRQRADFIIDEVIYKE